MREQRLGQRKGHVGVVGEFARSPRTAADQLTLAREHGLRESLGMEATTLELERRAEGVADG